MKTAIELTNQEIEHLLLAMGWAYGEGAADDCLPFHTALEEKLKAAIVRLQIEGSGGQ